MWHIYDGHFWGMHWFWWIIWAILLILIFSVNRRSRSKHDHNNKEEDPLKVLKRRYAAGEISTEEYVERKKVLEKDS